jgi:hypothetical protein
VPARLDGRDARPSISSSRPCVASRRFVRRLEPGNHLSSMSDVHKTLRYERVFELPSPSGKIELKIQQGGAGRFYIIASLPTAPQSGEIVLSVPTELADSLNNAIGKAADFSGE